MSVPEWLIFRGELGRALWFVFWALVVLVAVTAVQELWEGRQ